MKVLIVGGGIAGCACAALLRKYKIADVTLVEKAPEFRNIGYLIGLWSTGRKALRELGIDGHVTEEAYEYDSDTVFDKRGRLMKVVSAQDFKVLGPPIIIKRTDLHKRLFELLHDVSVRFNTTCTNIVPEGEAVRVEFNDNTQEVFDLVIGADGVKSSVREMVFGKKFMHHYGWRVWMWWIPYDWARLHNLNSYYGNGKVCATLPFLNTSVAILFAKVPPRSIDEPGKIQDAKIFFKDFCEDAQKIVDSMPVSEEIYHDNITYVKMPHWYKGNVVLIGDAQHAVSPVTGMGASMAMEDALVLVEELRRNTDIQKSLSNFARRREKRIRYFRRMVDLMDKWTMADGILGHIRNMLIPLVPTRYFVNIMRRFIEAVLLLQALDEFGIEPLCAAILRRYRVSRTAAKLCASASAKTVPATTTHPVHNRGIVPHQLRDHALHRPARRELNDDE